MRRELKGLAKQTLEIVEKGEYTSPSGATRSIKSSAASSIAGTRLYSPDQLSRLDARTSDTTGRPQILVTNETTGQAARRLYEIENKKDVVALNFASAKNPGGGFLGGARAQEEDLARCSALYPCLLTQPHYYDVNRANQSLLYTDYLIYSPSVPFFRDEKRKLVEQPFLVSIITSPAPNAGECLKKGQHSEQEIEETLKRRARHILLVASQHGHKSLVLGAWGCGVFRNDPSVVATAFEKAILVFGATFEQILFAVPGDLNSRNHTVFTKHFG